MNESIFRFPKLQPHNDDGLVETIGTEEIEKTKVILQYIRKVHSIKSDSLGYCYDAIGDRAWQLLCEIRLHNIDRVRIDQSTIEKSMDLTDMIAKRYLEILQTEMLLEKTPEDRNGYQNLKLTEFGRLKVQSIIDDCADIFSSDFIFSQPGTAESD